MKAKRPDPLDELINAASIEISRKLIKELAGQHVYGTDPWEDHSDQRQIRRECFDFLKKHVRLGDQTKAKTATGAVFALWDELEPDLSELDCYGGGDEAVEVHVGDLLYELAKRLGKKDVPRADRRALLDPVLRFIRSGNAGMDDPLYEVAYATCHNDEDWRYLAGQLENMGGRWKLRNAMEIYRRIGGREKYLSLRLKQLEFGSDYHDLATFYWQIGEHQKAFNTARKGLEKGEGRLTDLRSFLKKHRRHLKKKK